MRVLYSIALYLLTPLILLHLLWRSIRNRDYLKRWSERLGIFTAPKLNGGIVIHAVSVGEVNAASPLIRGLSERFPDLPLVVTTFTPTGSERVQSLYGDRLFHVYAPFDLPGSVTRFYNRIQPKMLVIMETEIWPNLYHGAARRGIPVIIANARVSEKSVRGYRWFPRLVRKALASVSKIAAQSETDAARLILCGAEHERIEVVGSLKFDVSMPASHTEQGEFIRQGWGASRPVWIAASTHEGDDKPVFDAHQIVLKKFPDALLLIVPRHPERFGRVYSMARSYGYETALRSENGRCDENTQCFVIDTMGELLLFCAASDVAFVGGSIAPAGGHNVLEPAALGRPVIMGPHMFNFEEIAARMLAIGAAVQVKNTAELADSVCELFRDADKRDRMGQAGLRLIDEGRGALARTLDIVAEYIEL